MHSFSELYMGSFLIMQKIQKCTLKTYSWETSHIGKCKINRKGLWDHASREKSVGKTTSYFQRKTRIWAGHGDTHAFNPSISKGGCSQISELEASLVYVLTSRTTRANRETLSQNHKTKQNNERTMRILNHLHFTANEFTHFHSTQCSLDSCSLTGSSN